MGFSRTELVSGAGVDPWTLLEKLTAGNPAEIESLAASFYRAAGQMDQHNSALRTAQGYVGEGYTVNDASPVDFGAEAASTRQSPEHLGGIATILADIANALDAKTDAAEREVSTLDSEVEGIYADYLASVQGQRMMSGDRQAMRQSYLDKAVEQVGSSGTAITTLITDYEIALMRHLKSLSDLGYVPPETLDEGPNVLDLDLSNLDGEDAGGINPDLPLDLASLQRLLDAARALGVDPHRYAALLQQYWLVTAAEQAGIDLTQWDPHSGVDGNRNPMLDVYRYYGNLFLEHPELQWAGMANMIGPAFAGGFMDLDSMGDFLGSLQDRINSLPGPARELLPQELRDLAAAGDLSGAELEWFEDKFLAMQKHIFIDQGAMHAAYLGGGTAALDEMRAAGLIDPATSDAWHDIASGDPARIENGNAALLSREQNQIIDNQYDQMRDHHGPVGQAMTYAMTALGAASIPGTETPGEFSPLTFGGEVTVPVPDPLPFVSAEAEVGVQVSTPLPDFNVSDRDSRWDYISNDTLPAYQDLLHDHPDQARQIIASPVEDRLAEQRLAERYPQVIDDLLTNWGVDVHGDVDVDVGLGW